MKTPHVFLITALSLLAASCTNELESGKDYPALAMGNETLVFKIDKVMQNDTDVKPYFTFFDGVELTLSYKDGEPSLLTFTQTGAPFRVTTKDYVDVEWEIYTGKSPYEIREKGTGRGDLLHDARPSGDLPVQAGSAFEPIRVSAPARSGRERKPITNRR